MALVVQPITCFTKSLFKSHIIIKNHFEPCHYPRTLFNLLRRKKVVSFKHPLLLSLHFSSLPLLHRLPSPHFSSPMSSLTSDQDSNSTPHAKTVRAVIKGRVHGVFYRDWTVENAKELGLKGWVRNRRDGTVEALFSGSPEKVQEMEQRCRRGPPAAIVTGLDVFPCDDDPGTGFERRQTG